MQGVVILKFLKAFSVYLIFFLLLTGCSLEKTKSIEIVESSNEVVDKNDDAETVDLVLFIGQSNMSGRGSSEKSIKVPQGVAYEYKSETDEIIHLKDPVGESEPNKAESGSLIPSLLLSLYGNLEEKRSTIAIVSAKGGSSVSDWQRGEYLYNLAVNKLNEAITHINSRPDLKIGKVYYVWLQGERDAILSTTKEEYINKYKQLHSDLLNDINANEGFMIRTGYDYRDDSDTKMNEKIISAQNSLTNKISDLIMISKLASTFTVENGLVSEDGVHYTQKGLNILGKDAGENLAEYFNIGTSPELIESVQGESHG
jgi:Carbohydrate esterase, sialic acid-specific acetylesterase